MEYIKTEFRQRAYDGKWEKIALIADVENAYSYKMDADSNVTVTYIPEKWVTVGVYDYEIEVVG